MSQTWHPLIAASDFPEEGKLAVTVGGWRVLVARTDDGFGAVNDRCTHQGAQLSFGKVRRGAVMCPLHGVRFNLATGQCIGAAYAALRSFALRQTDGMIEISVPDEPPRMDELPIPT